jgi:PKD repeat protein
MKKALTNVILSLFLILAIVGNVSSVLAVSPPVAEAGPNQTANEGTSVTFDVSSSHGSRKEIKVMIQYGSWWTSDLETYLDGLSDISCVHESASNLATLRKYDVVILYGNQASYNWTAYNQYVSEGHGLISTPWVLQNTGTFDSCPAARSSGGGIAFHRSLSVNVLNSSDPLLDGVVFHAGDDVGMIYSVYTKAGASNSVSWTDGSNAVVKWSYGSGRSVFLNFHYITSDCGRACSYDWGKRLIYNAIKWAATPSYYKITKYEWDFNGDGTFDYQETQTSAPDGAFDGKTKFTYNDNGIYTVTLRVTDELGGTATDTCTCTVNNVPPTVEAGSNKIADEGTTVSFSGAFTDPGILDTHTIVWNFGDGTSPVTGTLSPTHVFADDGTYTVTLTVTDDDGGVGTDTLIATIQDLSPTAGFSWSPEPQNEGAAVSFTDTSTSYPDTIVSWSWNFGGIGTSNRQNPTFTFVDNGVYTVTLTVTDDDGSVSSVSHAVSILDLSPTAGFSWAPEPQNEGAAVSFTDMSTSYPDAIVSWSWDFGGLGVSSEQNPSFTFMDNGAYTVTLKVTDDDGSENSVSRVVNVADLSPTAEFAWSPEPQNEGAAVNFTDASTSSPDSIVSWSWDFDGLGTSSEQNPSFTFMDNGAYTVTLTVTDDDGSVGSTSHVINVLDLSPTAAFNWSPEPQSEGAAVGFADMSTSYPDIIVSWSWDFGGLGASNEQNPVFTFVDNGVYTVTLTVTDDDGSVSSVSHVVSILDLSPTAEFSWSPEPQNEGAPVVFSDLSTSTCDSIVSWQWDFGGISASAEQNPSFTFMDNGTYTVTLTVTDDDGSVSSVSHVVNVLDLSPTAEFNWSPEPQNEGAAVSFTDTSTSYPDAIVSWSWNFGGLGSSTEQNPSFTFVDNGAYTVTLTVTDDDGSVSTISHIINIEDLSPTAEFSSSPEPSLEGSIIAFTDLSTSSPDAIVSWSWDFGDGQTSADANPTHAYADDGVYTVALTVTDDDGSTATVSHAVTVLNVAPTVNAGEDQTADEGSAVSFSGSFTDPGTADTHTVAWDFGDGETAEGTLTPTHVYADNGVYTVVLTVVDDEGAAGTDTLTVTVNNVAPTVEAGPDQTAAEGSSVAFSGSFTDMGVLDTHTITWDFGDGTSQVTGVLNPSHVYADNGVYTATLTVSDNDGGVGLDTLAVTVYNVAPTVNAGSDITCVEGDTVAFSGSFTDPGADTYTIAWSFGDGSSATGTLTPTHAYTSCGTYTVTLTVTDDDGGVGADTLTVTVKGPKSLKADALNLLLSLQTGDKKVDWAIECAAKLVRFSLNSQFWADGDHLAVTGHGECGWQPTGKMVFIYEGLAIGEMRGYIEFWQKKGPTTQQQQAIDLFNAVIAKLVKADQLLVQTALGEAEAVTPPKNPGRLNAYNMAIRNAEKNYGTALNYVANGKPWLAVVNFMQAWDGAQLAISLAR